MREANILNRSLVWWFGKFDPDNLSDAQMEMYEKQEDKFISYDIERVNISANGIYPSSLSVKERKEITKWAKKIYKDFISIKKLSGMIDLPKN